MFNWELSLAVVFNERRGANAGRIIAAVLSSWAEYWAWARRLSMTRLCVAWVTRCGCPRRSYARHSDSTSAFFREKNKSDCLLSKFDFAKKVWTSRDFRRRKSSEKKLPTEILQRKTVSPSSNFEAEVGELFHFSENSKNQLICRF